MLFTAPVPIPNEELETDRACLSVSDILDYADSVDLTTVAPILQSQIETGTAIAEEGLAASYGAEIGKMLLSAHPDDVSAAAKAYAAAGLDAHMGGCELPVMRLCGSESAAITAAVPVVCYARKLNIPAQRRLRALLVSDLLTVSLNAQSDGEPNRCSASAAGCAVGAAIAYLCGFDAAIVEQSFCNAVSLRCDMLCGGAGASCALKIASAIDAGLLGLRLSQRLCTD